MRLLPRQRGRRLEPFSRRVMPVADHVLAQRNGDALRLHERITWRRSPRSMLEAAWGLEPHGGGLSCGEG
jgi:hypothetical protein